MKIRPLAVLLFLASATLLGQQYEVYRQFVWPYGPAADKLTVASDGNLYGTSGGGDFEFGEIFRLVPDGSGEFSYERLYSFLGLEGFNPSGVVQGADGRFYGTTATGGPLGGGTVYRFDPATGLVVLHSFGMDSFYGAFTPDRLVPASDGNLYGITRYGGAHGWGMVYRVTPAGVFTELHDFAGPEGQRPVGALVQASDGFLYGVATFGGNSFAPRGPAGFGLSGGGTIFRSDFAGNVTTVYEFPGQNNNANGDLFEAPDGFLYGTTFNDGASATGSVYKCDKLGNATVLRSFPTAADDGQFPIGGLARTPDGNLWGTTTDGGSGSGGTVFRVSSDGTVTNVVAFGPSFGNVVAAPFGVTALPDGSLAVVTFWGGQGLPRGVALRVPLPDTNYQVLHEFGGPPPLANPASALVQTPDGTLWGTAAGGSANLGGVYRLSGDPMLVHEFSGAADGANPGALYAAADGSLYGVTASQGPGGSGTVFHLDADGTFTTLHPFAGPDGAQPEGPPMQASDGNFYGTTGFGGANGGGTLYRLTSSGTHTRLHDFTANAIPEEPRGRIIQASDGFLYLTTFSTFGSLYRSDLDGNLTDLHDFSSVDVTSPPDGVIQADDGNFYGTARYDGSTAESLGSIFRFTLPSTYDDIHYFSDHGRSLGTVTQGGDGRLYGTATGESSGGSGGVWVSDLSGANFQWIRQLSGSDGDTPSSTLLRAADGMLYGTTELGGYVGLGLVFRLDLAGSPPAIANLQPASGTASGGVPMTIQGDHFHPGMIPTVGGIAFASQDDFDRGNQFALTPPLTPGTLNDVTVTNADGQFATLPQAYFADFLDAPAGSLFHDDIEAIFRDGITAGCGGGSYCGGAAVTRGQMAVFLLKEMHGSSYVPPPCAGVFPDVPCPSMFADWIEELTVEGISAGCGGGLYCPQGFVPRANASVLLLKAEHGTNYVPPPCTGVFADVACPSTYADWIERLAAEGVTGGCGDGSNYCPNANATRGQMATFLEKTATLP